MSYTINQSYYASVRSSANKINNRIELRVNFQICIMMLLTPIARNFRTIQGKNRPTSLTSQNCFQFQIKIDNL